MRRCLVHGECCQFAKRDGWKQDDCEELIVVSPGLRARSAMRDAGMDRDAETYAKWRQKRFPGYVEELADDRAKKEWKNYVVGKDGSEGPVLRNADERREYYSRYGFRELAPGEVVMPKSQEQKRADMRARFQKKLAHSVRTGDVPFPPGMRSAIARVLGI